MPDYGNVDFQDYSGPSSSTFDATDLTGKYAQSAAMATQPGNYGAITTIAGDAALAAPDLVDTISSSIPFISSGLGIKRGDFNEGMLRMIDQPGLTNFYRENKGGVEIGSTIAGVIGAEIATGGMATALAPYVGAMRTASWAKKAMSLDTEYNAALANVKAVDLALGQRAALGASQYVDAASILPTTVGMAGELVQSTTPTIFSRAAAANSARRLGFADKAFHAASTEALMATTMNQNSFLYSDDASTNIMFGALGIGIGGAFGYAGANYAMRKFVNSDQMQRVYAAALDSTGLEKAMIDPSRVIAGAKGELGSGTYLGSLGGHISDRVTALMVQAKAAPRAGVDASNAARLATQQTALANEEVQKLTIKGIRGVEGTSASMGVPGIGNHVRQILSQDEGSLLQTEMMGATGSGLSTSKVYAEHVEHVQSRLNALQETVNSSSWGKIPDDQRAAIGAEIKQLKWIQTFTPVPYIDGEATTLSHAAAYDNWFEPEISAKSDEGLKTWEATSRETKKPAGVGIDSDMSIYLPGRKTLSNADHFDMLRLYRSAQQAIKDTLRDPLGVLKLPEKPNWFQLDMAETMLQKTKNSSRVVFPGTMTRESAQVESFAQKVDALASSHLTDDPTDIAKLRVRYNLPKLTAYEVGVLGTEEHPLDMIVRGAIAKGGGDAIRGMPLGEVLDGITQSGRLTGLTANSAREAKSLLGNTFNFLHDFEGNPTTPLLALKRPFAPAEYIRDNLEERLAQRKLNVITALTDNRADDLTRTLTTNWLQSPDSELASRVSSLADVQMSAMLPGLDNRASSSGVKAITDGMSTTEWKFRDTPIMQAITRSRETFERVTQNYMRQAFEGIMGPILPTLNGPRNAESKLLLDQFHTHAPGWELTKTPLDTVLPNGKKAYQFILEDTAANRERFQQQFGREMKPGEPLQTPQGKPMILDDLGLQAQQAFNQLTAMRRVQQNVLRSALGMPEARSAAWYVPPANVEGKIVGHTYDSLGRIVPGGTVIANTQEQFARQVRDLQDAAKYPNSPLLREGHVFRTQNEVREFATAMDRAEQDMVNPGRTFIGPTKSNYGGSAGQAVNVNAFQDSLTTMRDGFLQHGRELHTLMYRDPIAAAKMRAQISVGAEPGNLSSTQKQKARTIYDYYVQEATGASPLSSPASWWGRKYNELEGSANKALMDVSPKAGRVFAQVRDYFKQAIPYAFGADEKAAFEKMATDLGPYMPFESVAQQLEAKGAGSIPPTLAKIMGGVNRFESTWVLRMLEPVQAAMNLAGMLNAAPAVSRFLTQKAGETVEEYAARVGHSAQIFNAGPDRQIGVLDMGKMMYRGFKRSWSKEADAEYDHMAANGFLSFQMADFKKAFNAAEERSGYERFMRGDPTAAAQGGVKGKFAERGLEGWLSVLTDKSEDFSRSWGHMMGLELAETLGINGLQAKHNFAHDVANKMIANYSPANRPEMFQGAVGAPIGLFQSFIWAYYQRMFRYVETGSHAALGAQYATQAGIFGMKTVPGFQEMNKMFFDGHDGKDSPYDSAVKRFGPKAGDLLMAGVLGNIPALFGGDAVDLTSRGDTSFRTPIATAPAVFSTAQKIYDGVAAGISLFGSRNPHITGTQIAEIASNTIPNRPIAGLIESTFAHGNDTDAYGQLVSKNADWMESAYRVMGTRSYRQGKDLEAFYSNKGAMEIQANQAAILRMNTRALIRDAHGDVSNLPNVFETYVANGGDPKRYKRWIKDQFVDATSTRSQRQLAQAIKDPNHSAEADRLLNAQVSRNTEDTFPDDFKGAPPDSMDSGTPTNSYADDAGMMYGTN